MTDYGTQRKYPAYRNDEYRKRPRQATFNDEISEQNWRRACCASYGAAKPSRKDITFERSEVLRRRRLRRVFCRPPPQRRLIAGPRSLSLTTSYRSRRGLSSDRRRPYVHVRSAIQPLRCPAGRAPRSDNCIPAVRPPGPPCGRIHTHTPIQICQQLHGLLTDTGRTPRSGGRYDRLMNGQTPTDTCSSSFMSQLRRRLKSTSVLIRTLVATSTINQCLF